MKKKKSAYRKQLEKLLTLIVDHCLAAPYHISEAAGKILDADEALKKLKSLYSGYKGEKNDV